MTLSPCPIDHASCSTYQMLLTSRSGSLQEANNFHVHMHSWISHLYIDVDSFAELDQTVVSESGAIRSCTDNLWASFLMVCKARLQWVSRCHMKWLPEGS